MGRDRAGQEPRRRGRRARRDGQRGLPHVGRQRDDPDETLHRLLLPDAEEIVAAEVEAAYTALNPIPVPWLAPGDVSDAVLFLASDEARFITGDTLEVALGWNARMAA